MLQEPDLPGELRIDGFEEVWVSEQQGEKHVEHAREFIFGDTERLLSGGRSGWQANTACSIACLVKNEVYSQGCRWKVVAGTLTQCDFASSLGRMFADSHPLHSHGVQTSVT